MSNKNEKLVQCSSDLGRERQPSEQRRRRVESKEERRRGREFTESCDLVNSGGDRAGRRERRAGCLLRRCQGDTGDYKNHFLKSTSQDMPTSDKISQKSLFSAF